MSPELKTKQLSIPPEKLINRLSFSHFAELITLDDPLKRTYLKIFTHLSFWDYL